MIKNKKKKVSPRGGRNMTESHPLQFNCSVSFDIKEFKVLVFD